MAWIKMRCELHSHPKVVRILSAMCPQSVHDVSERLRVIGGLHAVWSVFDTHSQDGILRGYTPELMDSVVGWQGFSSAMISAKWLEWDGCETLAMPEFDAHNGQSAKRRGEDQKRKRDGRKNSSADGPQNVRTDADKKRTREDKSSKPPISPKGDKPTIEFKTFLADCKVNGEKPMADYKPVFAYAEKVGIPMEFVQLAWFEFGRQFGDGGVNETRKQKDWRKTFRNYVEKGYLKLWWLNPEGNRYELTTLGRQAQIANAERIAA